MTPPLPKTYRPWAPELYQQVTLSPRSQLPPGDLVFFLLDVLPQFDLTPSYAPYEVETRGAPPFDPAEMVGLTLYSYCVGVFSGRKMATACERNPAFWAIAGKDRPDFRAISDFRKLHLAALADLFTGVLRLAHAAGLVQLGLFATDGSKRLANASRHKAMSYGHLKEEAERLQAESTDLPQQARQVDAAEDAALGARRGDELPAELRSREQRLAEIVQARQRLGEQAKAQAEAERQRRAESAEAIRQGRQHAGSRPSKPIDERPDDKAPTSFTDPGPKIMPQGNKGWDYGGDAQVVADDACQVIVACDVVTEANDKQQAVPMARQALANLQAAGVERPTDAVGRVQKIAGALDSGYLSALAVSGLEEQGFEPYTAPGRQEHHAPAPAAVVEPVRAGAPAPGRVRAKLRAALGRAAYGLRKGVVEPVFGQIKGGRGFRRFSLRGLEKAKREWRLVCLTHNPLELWRYGCVPSVN